VQKVPAISFGGRRRSAAYSQVGKSNCWHFTQTAGMFTGTFKTAAIIFAGTLKIACKFINGTLKIACKFIAGTLKVFAILF
jgi:hypothetical protein